MSLTRTIEQTAVPTPGVWQIDPAHTTITVIARHLMVAKVRGTFGEVSGMIEVAEDPTESSVEVVAIAASITTGVTDRDNHLRSQDFLDAENHPEVRFVATSVAPAGGHWSLTGDLTIRGVTKPVTFDLVFEGAATDPFGNKKAVFVATGEIDREQWGLTWNAPLEGGGVLVSKTFQVVVEAQAILQV